MPITFNSPQDQYGLQAAGSILADTLIQNAQQRNLTQSRNQQQSALAQALSIAYDPSSTPQEKNLALTQYVSSGGNVSDISSAYKALTEQNQMEKLFSQVGINLNPQGSTRLPQNGMAQNIEMGDVNQQETVKRGNFYETIDDNTAFALASSPNKQVASIGKAAVEAKKLDQSRFDADRKFESTQSTPFLKEVNDQRQALRNKEFASENLGAAISEGNTGLFSIDNISRIFGRPELLSQSGAQLLGSVKELLVSNISRVGADLTNGLNNKLLRLYLTSEKAKSQIKHLNFQSMAKLV